MQHFTLNLTLTGYIGNLRRERHSVVIPQFPDGRVLIGEKNYLYPPDIYRLVGGGVEPLETPEQAAIRETEEELGITVSEDKLIALADIITNATTPDNKYSFTTYMYLLPIAEHTAIHPADDLSGVKILSVSEFPELITKYNELKDDHIFKDGDYQHSWGDYGKIYGPIHQIAYDLLKSRK